MDILTKIVEHTHRIVDRRRKVVPLAALKEKAAENDRKPCSLASALRPDTAHVIAEFKRKSPSRPNINLAGDPIEMAVQYEQGGASAMSVLTEPEFFAGSPEDMTRIRAQVDLPLLRKDFMIEPYQFFEARCMGADLVLLIARILDRARLREFCTLAHDLGLEVLCEIHNAAELDKVGDTPVDFLGVNCRDLQRFQTNLDHLVDMAALLPSTIPWVAESGIHGPADLKRLFGAGYRLFLIGEYLMKSGQPARRLEELRAL